MSISSIDFEHIRKLIYEKTSVILPDNKVYFVESRLAPIANSEKLNSVSQLIAQLRTNPWNDYTRSYSVRRIYDSFRNKSKSNG